MLCIKLTKTFDEKVDMINKILIIRQNTTVPL